MFLTIPPRRFLHLVVKQPNNISKILAHQQSILGMCERCIDVKPMRILKMMKVFNIKNKTELYTQIAIYIYVSHKYTYDLYYVYFPSTLQMDK